MKNLVSLPPSAPAADPPPLGLQQPASGGLLCCAPASLALPRRPPLPSSERPLRLLRSRWTAEHRGWRGKATTDGQASTRHEQCRIWWEHSRAGVGCNLRCLGGAAGCGAVSASLRRAAGRRSRLSLRGCGLASVRERRE